MFCYYLFFVAFASIHQDKIKSKSIGKQEVANSLTCYILMFYSVLYKQFCGRFYVDCNTSVSHEYPVISPIGLYIYRLCKGL